MLLIHGLFSTNARHMPALNSLLPRSKSSRVETLLLLVICIPHSRPRSRQISSGAVKDKRRSGICGGARGVSAGLMSAEQSRAEAKRSVLATGSAPPLPGSGRRAGMVYAVQLATAFFIGGLCFFLLQAWPSSCLLPTTSRAT